MHTIKPATFDPPPPDTRTVEERLISIELMVAEIRRIVVAEDTQRQIARQIARQMSGNPGWVGGAQQQYVYR